jgi:hypothetical protein
MAAMSTKSRQVIYGGRIIGAKIRAEGAREAAQKAVREADRAAAELWSIQMEAYGGPAQPSPTIACHLPLAAIAAASKRRLEHGKRIIWPPNFADRQGSRRPRLRFRERHPYLGDTRRRPVLAFTDDLQALLVMTYMDPATICVPEPRHG